MKSAFIQFAAGAFFALAANAQGATFPANTPAQIVCQTAFQQADFAGLERAYTRYAIGREKNDEQKWKSEECVESISVFAADEAQWNALNKKTEGWVQRSPQSTLAGIVRAKALIARAGQLDNRDAKWNVIDVLLNAAAKVLSDYKQSGTKDPNWHVQMLALAKLRDTPSGKVIELVKQAIESDPQAFATYKAASLALAFDKGWAKPDLVEWMARLAVEKTKDSEAQSRYALIYGDAAVWFMELRIRPFGPGRAEWSTLNQAFKDVEKYHPKLYKLNLHAAFACLAGDKNSTSYLIKRVGTDVRREDWFLGRRDDWATGREYDRCKRWSMMGDKTA